MADENMVHNALQPPENYSDGGEEEWGNEESDENCNEAEFAAINDQLDQLHSALDNLERKNDDIRAELVELLQSNREARKQFQECQNDDNVDSPNPDA